MIVVMMIVYDYDDDSSGDCIQIVWDNMQLQVSILSAQIRYYNIMNDNSLPIVVLSDASGENIQKRTFQK